MSAFRESIAKEVKLQMMNPEFDSRRSKNGGRIFWVRSASSNGFGQFVKEHPAYDDGVSAVYTSISSALAVCQANRGDEVRVGPGYTETLTEAMCISTAGVRLVGEGSGQSVPAITVNGTVHGIALAANGTELENFRFPAPETDAALSMVRIDDDIVGATVKNIVGIGSSAAKNFVDCISIGARAHNHTLQNINLTTSKKLAVVNFLNFEGSVCGSTIGGFYAVGCVSTAGISDASGAVLYNAQWNDLRIAVGGAAKPAVTINATGGDGANGQVTNSHLQGTHTTIANNAAFTGDWRLSQVYVSEETGNVAQGALIPAVDAD